MQHHTITEQIQNMPVGTGTYGGSVIAIASWGLSAPDIAAIVGAVVAVVGLTIQIWATWRRDKREVGLYEIALEESEADDIDEIDEL